MAARKSYPFLHRFVMIVAFLLMVTVLLPQAASAQASDAKVGWLTIDGPLNEEASPLAWLFSTGGNNETLSGFIQTIDQAKNDPEIGALAIHVRDFEGGLSQVMSIGAALKGFEKSGKSVHVFCEAYGPLELLLGSYADDVVMQQGGEASFPGLYTQEMYLADTLGLIGLKADMVQIGAYKGASEPMGRSSPSPEWSENINGLLDDLWAQMKEQLQSGRHLTDNQMATLLDQGWAADADKAVQLKMVDKAMDVQDFPDYVKQQTNLTAIDNLENNGEDQSSQLDMSNPWALMGKLMREPDRTPKRPTIAVIYVDGTIVDGESSPASLFGGSSVGSRTIRKALQEIGKQNLIKGMIVRINSPGGSAMASEVMWQGIRRIADKIPVYISVGSMAASGGYYTAVSGDRIYVEPCSIVGSIGVVGGKIVMGGLFDKLKVGVTARGRGPHADMAGTLTPWSDADRARIRDEMTQTYSLFTQRVTQGRGKHGIDLSKVAEGRVFTGREAIRNGMADGIADMGGTIRHMASDLGLAEGSYDVMTYPGPKSLMEMIQDMLPGGLSAVNLPNGLRTLTPSLNGGADLTGLSQTISSLRLLVGENQWPVLRDALDSFMLLRHEHVLLVSPRVVLFH